MWVVDLSTGRKRHVAGGRGDYFEAGVWSPDGTRIVFPRELKQSGRKTYALWLMHPDGSAKTQLTSDAARMSDDQLPAWSPGGKQIVFTRTGGHGSDLVLVTIAGRRERTLVRGAVGLESPTWSHDGSLIAFGKTRAGRSSLWIVHRDGSMLRQLTSTRLPDAAPAWQP